DGDDALVLDSHGEAAGVGAVEGTHATEFHVKTVRRYRTRGKSQLHGANARHYPHGTPYRRAALPPRISLAVPCASSFRRAPSATSSSSTTPSPHRPHRAASQSSSGICEASPEYTTLPAGVRL